MAQDLRALERAPQDDFLLRFYVWKNRPAATFGAVQKMDEVRAYLKTLGKEALPAARRPTGGGVVVHENDLTFSVVFPWGARRPEEIYRDFHTAVAVRLQGGGIPCVVAAGVFTPARACFSHPAPGDVLWDGRKILGGALRKRKGRGLYQGSLQISGVADWTPFLRGAVLKAAEVFLEPDGATLFESNPEVGPRTTRP